MRPFVRAVPLMLLTGVLLVGCTTDSPGPKDGRRTNPGKPQPADNMYLVAVDGMH